MATEEAIRMGEAIMTVKMIYILNDILANAHFAMSFNKENTLGFAKWSN